MKTLSPRKAYERLLRLKQKVKTDTNAQVELDDLQDNYDWKNQIFEKNGRKGLKDILGNILIPLYFMRLKTRIIHYLTTIF